MKIKLGGSKGKAWQLQNVKKIVITAPYPDKSFIDIDIEGEDGIIRSTGFSEAGTIRIDNKKAAQS